MQRRTCVDLPSGGTKGQGYEPLGKLATFSLHSIGATRQCCCHRKLDYWGTARQSIVQLVAQCSECECRSSGLLPGVVISPAHMKMMGLLVKKRNEDKTGNNESTASNDTMNNDDVCQLVCSPSILDPENLVLLAVCTAICCMRRKNSGFRQQVLG